MDKAFLLFGGLESSVNPDMCLSLISRGFMVLIIDTPKNRRGRDQFLNEAIPRDKVDYVLASPSALSTIIKAIDKWKSTYTIIGGLNTTEEYLVSSALALQYLHLPGPGVAASLITSDKSLQRAILHMYGPKSVYVTEPDDMSGQELNYPVLIKATNLHGGAGIYVAKSHQELKNHLLGPNKIPCLVEEYIQGIDVSVESLVNNRSIIYQNITEEISLPPPLNHLEMGYCIPSHNISELIKQKLYEINKNIIQAVDLITGITHAEYRITEKGDVYYIEMGARQPGDNLLRMYQLSTGTRIEEALIDLVLGKEVEYPPVQRWVKQIFFEHNPGKFLGLNGIPNNLKPTHYQCEKYRQESVNITDGNPVLHEILCDYSIGEQLPQLATSETRLGSYIFSARSKKELQDYELSQLKNLMPVVN